MLTSSTTTWSSLRVCCRRPSTCTTRSRNQHRFIFPGSGDIDSNLNREDLQFLDFLGRWITLRLLDQLKAEYRVSRLGWELAEHSSAKHRMLGAPSYRPLFHPAGRDQVRCRRVGQGVVAHPQKLQI